MFGNGKKAKAGEFKLPNWAEWRDDGAILIDPNKVYPLYLAQLKVIRDASDPFRDRERITQFWLEVAQRCVTEDLKRWAITQGAKGLHLAWRRDPRWAFRQFQLARYSDGSHSADRGRAEFRLYYNRIRNLQSNGARRLAIPKWGGGDMVHRAGFKDPLGTEHRAREL